VQQQRFHLRASSSLAAVVEHTTAPRQRLEDLREKLRVDNPVKLQVPAKPKQKLEEDWEFLNQLPDPEDVLTDRFERNHTYLRISLTERCNLRCTYCMPPEGVPLQQPEHLLTTDEVLHLARHFSKAGVTKFRLTGGEPTLRRDLVDVVAGINKLEPEQIGMTTNGITLAKNLDELVDAGMNSINISLDTLSPDKFAELTRRPAAYLDRVWKSLEACAAYDHITVKINCVVMRGVNDDEVRDFIELGKEFPSIRVRFIEYMPFSDNGWNTGKFIGYEEMLEQNPDLNLTRLPEEDPHDTTKWFSTDYNKVGFITSMSSHFCAGCNRLRLTTDGQIKVCLFDRKELSLRDALRAGLSEKDMNKLIHAALQNKQWKLGGHRDPEHINETTNTGTSRPMILIGG
jgi:molybdenum cofactor biosynthesis protein A